MSEDRQQYVGSLYVIRHGETAYNAQGILQGPRIDPELSDVGQDQARRVATALQDTGVDIVFTSPLLRARQTAAALTAGREPVRHAQIMPEVYELDYGELTGRPIDEVRDRRRQILDAWAMGFAGEAFPGGESALLAQQRIGPSVERLREQALQEDVAIVAHGDINRLLIASLTGEGLSALGRYHQSNGGISQVDIDDEGVRVICLDDTRHLA